MALELHIAHFLLIANDYSRHGNQEFNLRSRIAVDCFGHPRHT